MTEHKSSINKLVAGLRRFADEKLHHHKENFARLAQGQNALAVLITCADSRFDAALVTDTQPGEMLLSCNAGNIVPPFAAGASGGEAATIEYALDVLNVEHVIVCGHSQCGAIHALLHPHAAEKTATVTSWFAHATNATKSEYLQKVQMADPVLAISQANVLLQLDHLKTYPFVQKKLEAGKLSLHAWFFEIETGTVYIYDENQSSFIPATSAEFAAFAH